ncbi:MAG: 1-(5-phosphoribosyl)-5-[(5-phosphoribosylamino)methylideneamino] imidazole-4-carboxamide isomerase [Clostridiales bacterium]|nr:1-(5-phosphoribosyl)-5-[(5-phosphoribosylamino)methylideneamino] imidazole-4-carboxamide isomerase [Clostridiales bacterium]
MLIIPAIDIREGACSRIFGDSATARNIYSSDPLQQVLLLKEAGAGFVHITDVDGAFSGHICNLPVIREIVAFGDIKIQLSGGVHNLDQVQTLLSLGVEQVVLSVAMQREPEKVAKAVKLFGERVLAGLDGRDGTAVTDGFETAVRITMLRQLEMLRLAGIKQIVYTDLRRAGTLKGPNFTGIEEIIKNAGVEVLVAGGIASLEAIEKLKNMGAAGVIIGKAIFTGAVDLAQAIKIAQG